MAIPHLCFQQSVLFIDDQTRFESLIRGGLFNFPAQYEFCPSRVTSAFERLQYDTPDLIVATLDFSEGSILELLEKTGGFLQEMPAIFLSEPHLADIEAEMALRGRFTLMERNPDPLDLILKMAQVISENVDAQRPRLNLGQPETESPLSEEALLQPDWASSILKKVR